MRPSECSGPVKEGNRTLNVAGAAPAVPSVSFNKTRMQVELLKSTLGSYNQSSMNSHGGNKSKPVHSLD